MNAGSCAEPGIFSAGSRHDGQKTAWTTSFSPQFMLQFTEGVQWFYYRDDYTFPRIQRGSNIFQGGGGSNFSQGGSSAYFFRNTYNL